MGIRRLSVVAFAGFLLAARLASASITAEIVFPKPPEGKEGDSVRVSLVDFPTDQFKIEFSALPDPNGLARTVVAPNGVVKHEADEKKLVWVTVPAGTITGPVIVRLPNTEMIPAGHFTIKKKEKKPDESDDSSSSGGAGLGGGYRGGGSPPAVPQPAPNPPNYDKDVDLPVEKPEHVPPGVLPPKAPPTPTPPPTPVEPPPPSIYGKDLKSESQSLVFALDISGSMAWEPAPYIGADGTTKNGVRIDRAKAELVKAIISLPRSFKFNVVAYDCLTYFMPNGTGGLLEANDTNKNLAIAWVNNLVPLGGTGTGPACSMALNFWKSNKLLILLTDGVPNCGAGPEDESQACMDAHRSQIRWANTQRATVSVFGIGATGEFKRFCQNVATENGGSYTDVR